MAEQMTLEKMREQMARIMEPGDHLISAWIDAIDAQLNAAKGEAVAWMVPRIVTFKGVMRTNAPPEFQGQIEGTVSWHPSLIGDAHPVTDKHGVTHKPRPLVYANDPTSPDVVRDAERWRFFCEEMTHSYGDGYSEPKECHAELSWQQGPWIRDGSNGGKGRPDTFPGWNSIIDEAMENQRRELADLEDEIDAAMATKPSIT